MNQRRFWRNQKPSEWELLRSKSPQQTVGKCLYSECFPIATANLEDYLEGLMVAMVAICHGIIEIFRFKSEDELEEELLTKKKTGLIGDKINKRN